VDFIVWQLRPTALDDLGLAAALADYVNTWSAHFGVGAELHQRGMEPGRLTDEIETAIYRILQEALNNIAKHAAARHVDILLEGRSDHVSLIVEDDGAGIDEKTVGSGDRRLGVIGMRERAALVGGTLDIESHHGHGTTVIARIPAPGDPARSPAR
jgi:signal transduction histidine kinase